MTNSLFLVDHHKLFSLVMAEKWAAYVQSRAVLFHIKNARKTVTFHVSAVEKSLNLNVTQHGQILVLDCVELHDISLKVRIKESQSLSNALKHLKNR